MSFFISVLHRVNFSVYPGSVFPCPHLVPGGLTGSSSLVLGQRSYRKLGSFQVGLMPNTQLRTRWEAPGDEPEITQLGSPSPGRPLSLQTLLRPTF